MGDMRTDWSSFQGVGRSVSRNISLGIPRISGRIPQAITLLLLGLLVAISQQSVARASTLRPGQAHGAQLSQAHARASGQEFGAGEFTAGVPRAGAPAWRGDIAAAWALRQLGKPYVWAAAGPNAFDCSGLSMRAWQRAGIQLVHWTGSQWISGPHIPLNRLRRGDLVFFANNIHKPATIHHVGIYIGGGKMVDAPYTGVDVRIDSIYEPGLIGATRPA